MTAMPAAIGERAQNAVFAPDQQNAPGACLLSVLVARPGDLRLCPAQTQPAPKKYRCSQANTAGST